MGVDTVGAAMNSEAAAMVLVVTGVANVEGLVEETADCSAGS